MEEYREAKPFRIFTGENDTVEKIHQFLPGLDGMPHDGLVTIETVEFIRYRPDPGKTNPDMRV